MKLSPTYCWGEYNCHFSLLKKIVCNLLDWQSCSHLVSQCPVPDRQTLSCKGWLCLQFISWDKMRSVITPVLSVRYLELLSTSHLAVSCNRPLDRQHCMGGMLMLVMYNLLWIMTPTPLSVWDCNKNILHYRHFLVYYSNVWGRNVIIVIILNYSRNVVTTLRRDESI